MCTILKAYIILHHKVKRFPEELKKKNFLFLSGVHIALGKKAANCGR
jgi:hypothetical protein